MTLYWPLDCSFNEAPFTMNSQNKRAIKKHVNGCICDGGYKHNSYYYYYDDKNRYQYNINYLKERNISDLKKRDLINLSFFKDVKTYDPKASTTLIFDHCRGK